MLMPGMRTYEYEYEYEHRQWRMKSPGMHVATALVSQTQNQMFKKCIAFLIPDAKYVFSSPTGAGDQRLRKRMCLKHTRWPICIVL